MNTLRNALLTLTLAALSSTNIVAMKRQRDEAHDDKPRHSQRLAKKAKANEQTAIGSNNSTSTVTKKSKPDGEIKSNPAKKLKMPLKTLEEKNSSDVFGGIAETQRSYKNLDPAKMKMNLNKHYFERKANFESENAAKLAPFKRFLRDTTITKDQIAVEECTKIINLLSGPIEYLIEHLYVNKFVSAQHSNAVQKSKKVDQAIEKYEHFIRLFFLLENTDTTDEYLLAIANRFFVYCFSMQSYDNFKQTYLNHHEYQGVLQFMYSMMTEHFTCRGWNNWSTPCLVELKKAIGQGKRVIYIAGGCDIHRLIDEGVYNITIVDPFLPTQEKFYTDGWEWFVINNNQSHGIGDTIIFEDQKVKLARAEYTEDGAFKATLATGEKAIIPKSVTTWNVYDMEDNKEQLGSIRIERRFCTEQDFISDDNQVVLVSFNELCCAANPKSWGLNLADEIPQDSIIFVKQLHQTIKVQDILNVMDSKESFRFCDLGECNTN